MEAFLNRRIDVETWLVYSSIVSVFLIVRVARIGADIFLGYPIVIFNTLLLLALGRLVIHRTHAIIVAAVVISSLLASHFSPTPVTAIMAQISGILLFSIYFFSMLLTSRISLPRWLELYAAAAFYLALYGIAENFAQRYVLHYDPEGEQRLKAIFREPSMFVYTTLPAVGYYINSWATQGRHKLETLIFLFAYVLANSALGYFGLLLIGAFTFIKRFTVWHVLAAFLACCAVVAAIFFSSEALRLRVTDVFIAVSSGKLAHTNSSTFALLSNIYVTGNAVADHPVLGVGIGGYRSTYLAYIGDVTADEKNLQVGVIGLNMDDANSLFVRVLAELGPFGLIALFSFLAICANVDGKPYRQIRNALLPYFFVRMARYGAYFSMELYFFVGLYLLNYLNYRRSIAAGAPAPLPAPPALRPA